MLKHKSIYLLLLLSPLVLSLTACSTSSSDEPGKVVTAFWQALVAKDDASLSSLSCPAYETIALTTLESFRAVEVVANDVSCSSSAVDDNTSSVKCTGTLVASYGAEKLTIDLSQRTFKAVKEGGNWLMCGEE